MAMRTRKYNSDEAASDFDELNEREVKITVMCLSIGTPKNNKFSIVPNGKLIVLGVPKFRQITT